MLISFFVIAFAAACAHRAEEQAAQKSGQPGHSSLVSARQDDIYSDGHMKLIKTANYRFQVDDVKESTDAILRLVRAFPAYVSGSSLHLENPRLENRMTIRVASENFNALLEGIDKEAKFVNFRNVTTDDVSKEFVDLESRLKTSRELEARYMEILRKKAGTIEELLKAEKEISEVHGEIEATISRINHLKDQVSYSTINLEFYQTLPEDLYAGHESVSDKFHEALGAGWDGVVGVSIALAYVWPLLVSGIGVLLAIHYRVFRKRAA